MLVGPDRAMSHVGTCGHVAYNTTRPPVRTNFVGSKDRRGKRYKCRIIPCAKGLTYTSLEGNTWYAELSHTHTRVLTDPWLVGNLTFGGLDFIYSGSKKVATPNTIDLDAMAKSSDFMLLTMSIDDHCHKPTLKALVERNRDLPIVASPSAAKVARDIGFRIVHDLDHGEQVILKDGTITVTATEGALVGPPWSKRENGFVIKEHDGISVYYEPHADYNPSSLKSLGTCDVIISPPCTQSLLGYDLVKGKTETIPLLELLRPKAVIALMNAEFDGSGPLAALISESGGPELLKQQIKGDGRVESDTKVYVPKAGEPLWVEI